MFVALTLLAGLALAETPVVKTEIINIDAGCGTGVTTPVVRPKSLFPGETEKKIAAARAIELEAKTKCVTAQANASATVQLARGADYVARKGGVVQASIVGGGTFGANLEKMPVMNGGYGGYGYVGGVSLGVSQAFLQDSGYSAPVNATSAPAPSAGSTPPTPTATDSHTDQNSQDGIWALGESDS